MPRTTITTPITTTTAAANSSDDLDGGDDNKAGHNKINDDTHLDSDRNIGTKTGKNKANVKAQGNRTANRPATTSTCNMAHQLIESLRDTKGHATTAKADSSRITR